MNLYNFTCSNKNVVLTNKNLETPVREISLAIHSAGVKGSLFSKLTLQEVNFVNGLTCSGLY